MEFTPQGRSNCPKLKSWSEDAQRGLSRHKPFCSLSLTELSLFTRGRKFVGSRRNVISSEARNLFIPVSSDCGLKTKKEQYQPLLVRKTHTGKQQGKLTALR
jgi:hypothetical protein